MSRSPSQHSSYHRLDPRKLARRSMPALFAWVVCGLLPALSACTAASSTPAPAPTVQASARVARVATSAEQHALLTAAIALQVPAPKTLFGPNAARRSRLVLEDSTVALCGSPPPKGKDCRELAGSSADSFRPAADLFEPLLRFNASPHPLNAQGLPGVVAVSREQVVAAWTLGSWSQFYKTYPQANGLLQVSRAVISAEGDRALLYVAVVRDMEWGFGNLHVFARKNGQWTHIHTVGMWIS